MDETVKCPDCGQLVNPAELERHQAESLCRAQMGANAAEARGLVRVRNPLGRINVDQEVLAPLERAGLVENLMTGVKVRWFFQKIDTRADRHERCGEDWVPAWAVMAASDAMDAGDDPDAAVHAYRMAVRECPEMETSMLADARILDKE
jgi:hypothetical protein